MELLGLIVEKLLISLFFYLLISAMEVQVSGPDFILVFWRKALDTFLRLNPPVFGEMTLEPGYL